MSVTGSVGDPKILYHYTSIDVFKSIIQTQKIRATRFDQMNDHGELQFGIRHLLASLELRDVGVEDQKYFEFLWEGIKGYEESQLDVYVLSFSEVADSLEQWRAYAPHGGVAIGFDFEKVRNGFLTDITSKVGGHAVANPIRPDPSNRLFPCEYSKKDGTFDSPMQLTDKFFAENSYAKLFRRTEQVAEAIFMSTLSISIYQSISSIKHGAYEGEKEWRCVNIRPNATSYPVKLNDKNRYFIELPFDATDFVKDVWLSPHGDSAGARNAVEHLKREKNLSYEIKASTIPYRI